MFRLDIYWVWNSDVLYSNTLNIHFFFLYNRNLYKFLNFYNFLHFYNCLNRNLYNFGYLNNFFNYSRYYNYFFNYFLYLYNFWHLDNFLNYFLVYYMEREWLLDNSWDWYYFLLSNFIWFLFLDCMIKRFLYFLNNILEQNNRFLKDYINMNQFSGML